MTLIIHPVSTLHVTAGTVSSKEKGDVLKVTADLKRNRSPHKDKIELLGKSGRRFGCLTKGHVRKDCKKRTLKHPGMFTCDQTKAAVNNRVQTFQGSSLEPENHHRGAVLARDTQNNHLSAAKRPRKHTYSTQGNLKTVLVLEIEFTANLIAAPRMMNRRSFLLIMNFSVADKFTHKYPPRVCKVYAQETGLLTGKALANLRPQQLTHFN
ncbi:hypothetical protein JOB18_015064 [Solea senegalensis]|uniref:Uncharacterized protein n=1 Tax=Solea senegalensis TaxID=28829 RepID=A0AAV6QZ91_SOLSE|nr:hypothetical protein JOB18_015064 [Solea senegalensis]